MVYGAFSARTGLREAVGSIMLSIRRQERLGGTFDTLDMLLSLL